MLEEASRSDPSRRLHPLPFPAPLPGSLWDLTLLRCSWSLSRFQESSDSGGCERAGLGSGRARGVGGRYKGARGSPQPHCPLWLWAAVSRHSLTPRFHLRLFHSQLLHSLRHQFRWSQRRKASARPEPPVSSTHSGP